MQTVFLFRDAQYVLTSRLNINIYQLFVCIDRKITQIFLQ